MHPYFIALKQLFLEFDNKDETGSQLASVTMRIMQALQTNLDGKSKQYKDPALTHLFLMNNIHYMVRSVLRYVMYILSEFFFKSWMIFLPVNTGASLISVFRSEAKDLLGDDWVQRHRRIVQQQANQYKRNAWAKVTFYQIKPHLNLLFLER